MNMGIARVYQSNKADSSYNPSNIRYLDIDRVFPSLMPNVPIFRHTLSVVVKSWKGCACDHMRKTRTIVFFQITQILRLLHFLRKRL